jgi:biotin carboxylase
MNILILGAGVMQLPAIKTAKSMGHFVLCADGNRDAVGKEFCDVFYTVDIKDRSGLLEVAEKFHEKHILHGVFTAGTDFSSSVAWISEKLSLPGIPYQAALNATDKYRMRSCFNEHNVPSPQFTEYSSEMDLSEIVKKLTFPLVVKPVDSMGSRGVCRTDNIKELKDATEDAIKHSRTSRAIIEEFIEGAEFSIDALVVDGEVKVFGFADREIQFPPFFVEMGHIIPTDLDESLQNQIIEVFSKGVKALGLTYGAAKGDMKLSKNGPIVGEIAARLSGGYMSGWTYPYSSGIELTKGAIELALGQPITIEKESLGLVSVERALISVPGKIKDIDIPSTEPKNLKDKFIISKPGDDVIFPRNNVEKCGNIITCDKSRDKAVKSAEKFASEIILRLEPGNWVTEEFLYNNSRQHAPKAFDLDEKLYAQLDDSVEFDGTTFYINRIDKILKSRKKDWQKRTVSQVLKLLSKYYTVEFTEDSSCGSEFYNALTSGSIQGVLYYFDSLEI